jgi:signal transduction histidine kinase
MKDEFLAVLSHELRTPLNAIIGYTNLLRAHKYKPEDAPRMHEIILRNARAQQQLVEDMLDVSRIITGKMGLNLGPVELSPVIRRALDTARPAAAAKQITIEADLDPYMDVITGDANRLQQAVWNLLETRRRPPGSRRAKRNRGSMARACWWWTTTRTRASCSNASWKITAQR